MLNQTMYFFYFLVASNFIDIESRNSYLVFPATEKVKGHTTGPLGPCSPGSPATPIVPSVPVRPGSP